MKSEFYFTFLLIQCVFAIAQILPLTAKVCAVPEVFSFGVTVTLISITGLIISFIYLLFNNKIIAEFLIPETTRYSGNNNIAGSYSQMACSIYEFQLVTTS
jgi:hypothetical protein